MAPSLEDDSAARGRQAQSHSPSHDRLNGLDGVLAAALERLARSIAAALRVPSAAIVILGEDRRCFAGGESVPTWLVRDPGALFRTGIATRLLASRGAIAVQDARPARPAPGEGAMDEALDVAAFLGKCVVDANGEGVAMVLALDSTPRQWTPVDVRRFDDIADRVLVEIESRRRAADAERIERMIPADSLRDHLTGLPNRLCFVEQLRHAAQRARRLRDRSFAVLFLDVDHFQTLNESLGHAVADELLAEIARRLATSLRGVDTLARLGADEFALLLEELHEPSDAARVAERLQRAIGEPLSAGMSQLRLSASIGIALSGRPDIPTQLLLRNADQAMYRAKDHGRARFEIFDPVAHAASLERLRLESDLRHALERDQFTLRYQPVVSLATGTLVAVEATVHWQHPERGLISAEDFIPMAERAGVSGDIGRWVLSRACEQMQTWEKTFGYEAPQSVWINVSTKQFAQRDLTAQIADVLGSLAVEPRRIKLEITESVMREDVEAATRTLNELRALGVQVFMDQFGTGYSSLSQLGRLPLGGIKVARAFVGRMSSDQRDAQMVRTIVTLIRNLGLEPIAEGVETHDQVNLLRDMGCAFAQGFAFSQPVPAQKIDDFLRERPAW